MFIDRLPYDDKYGLLDPMLGDSVTVDGVSLYDYNADLIKYEPVVASITSNIYKKVGGHSYILNNFNNGNNGIKFSFYVGGQNIQQAQVNCNRIIREFQKGIVTVVIGDTEFEYSGIMSTYSMKYTDVYNYYLLEVTFISVKRLPFVLCEKSSGLGNIHINNDGIIDCGLIIVLESNLSQESVTVVCNSVSITINNFSSYKYHIIDGLNGNILCGTGGVDIKNDLYSENFESYINNFANTNLLEFPYIVPGENDISIDGYSGINKVMLKYYPTFVI